MGPNSGMVGVYDYLAGWSIFVEHAVTFNLFLSWPSLRIGIARFVRLHGDKPLITVIPNTVPWLFCNTPIFYPTTANDPYSIYFVTSRPMKVQLSDACYVITQHAHERVGYCTRTGGPKLSPTPHSHYQVALILGILDELLHSFLSMPHPTIITIMSTPLKILSKTHILKSPKLLSWNEPTVRFRRFLGWEILRSKGFLTHFDP